jgi:hypothetical protein
MTTWGICATVKAPAAQVLAFVAHHLTLGAEEVTICLDDPADPVGEVLGHIPGVTVHPCDVAWWQALEMDRPDKHQVRQVRNANRVLRQTALPWIAHLDVDEFLLAHAPVGSVLATIPDDQPVLRLPPFEALTTPGLPDDIFTATQFRAAMVGRKDGVIRRAVFGDYAALLPRGVLSHAEGKCFFRSGVPGLQARLHSGFMRGERLDRAPSDPRIDLLHFHAQDGAAWRRALPFRLSRGAYQFNPALREYLTGSTEAEIEAFHRAVQQPPPHIIAMMRDAGKLREARLDLRAKVERLPIPAV